MIAGSESAATDTQLWPDAHAPLPPNHNPHLESENHLEQGSDQLERTAATTLTAAGGATAALLAALAGLAATPGASALTATALLSRLTTGLAA